MPTIFLDRDGVINQNIKGGYVTSWEQFAWLPGVIQSIRLLNERGWKVIVITNQACIGKGIMSMQNVLDLHNQMVIELQKNHAFITQIYVCPHKADADCTCRKPKPGLLQQAANEYNLELSDCYFVGDSITDMKAAKAVDCYGILVRSGLGRTHENETRALNLAHHYCETIYEAITHIIKLEEVK